MLTLFMFMQMAITEVSYSNKFIQGFKKYIDIETSHKYFIEQTDQTLFMRKLKTETLHADCCIRNDFHIGFSLLFLKWTA